MLDRESGTRPVSLSTPLTTACVSSPGTRAQTDGGSRQDARELETLKQARSQLEAQVTRAAQDLKDVQRVSRDGR